MVKLFEPRTSAPAGNNPYYVHTSGGGYNKCIKIIGNSCLPNCVGYAYGRFMEIAGITQCALPRCNAEDWYEMAQNAGYTVGSTPKLGAVIVWRKGKRWNSSDGCGHVAIVERINADGSILVSGSNYTSSRTADAIKRNYFTLTTLKKPYSISGQVLLGFIYNPGAVTSIPASENAIYRMYNRYTGEHLFTPYNNEANSLYKIGWTYEGIAWHAPDDGETVYRLYNPNAGDHHYTVSTEERDALIAMGWHLDTAVFKSGGKVPIYRTYNMQRGWHMYTASKSEYGQLVKAGWKDEGIAFYGVEE